MKVDKFTKLVLTVIAVNLSILTVKNLDLIPKVQAHEPSPHLNLAPETNYGLVPLNDDGTINVRLSTADELDVNIVGIKTYDVMDVNIDEVGGGFVSYGGPIAVEID